MSEMIARVLTRRKVLAALIAVVVAAVTYTAWIGWQIKQDLQGAQSSVATLQSSLSDGDAAAARAAFSDLRDSASAARETADGRWWGALTKVPLFGDDAEGVRGLARAVDTIADRAADPLIDSAELVDQVNVPGSGSTPGGVDLAVVRRLEAPVAAAHAGFAAAAEQIGPLESDGYAGVLKSRFNAFRSDVLGTRDGLAAGIQAIDLAPSMLGEDGPRNYLLVFQNNAEIRATGGMPGSWALLRAENGRLSMQRQGTGGSFGGELPEPVLPLSAAETRIYGTQLGTYFQDAGFTPDFPRSAALFEARWARQYDEQLDGVLALDPVALSYLLKGTGPVDVAGRSLTSDNVVDELLSRPYRTLDTTKQDALFQQAAKAIFEAATGELPAPLDFARGLNRAADEGRLLVASFHEDESEQLSDSRVAGALTGDDGDVPHVDIGLNDATGSKMSYYLRYFARVNARSCSGDTQGLSGSMTMSQAISPAAAAALPESVTGGGNYGTQPGSQLVLVRLYAPFGGSLDRIVLDGKEVKARRVDLDGRQAAMVVVLLSSVDDIVLTWQMTSGPGQTGDGELGLTPSVVPGSNDSSFESAC